MARVSIIKTQEDCCTALGKALDDIQERVIAFGDHVLIKPNLVEPADPESGQISTPRVIEAVARYCLDCGASKVVIGEGPGYYQPSSYLRDCFTLTGVAEVADRLGIPWVLFDEHEYRTFPMVPDCIPREFRITEFAFNCDKFINLPVLKTHWLTTVTLAMKNLKGCLKREDKPLFHRQDINRAIVELNKIVRPSLNIIDGTPKTTVRQLGTGYSFQKKTNGGLLIISSDIVSTDAVGSALMGIDPASVTTIALGAASGLGEGNLTRIDIIGEEVNRLKFKLRLPQEELKESFPFLEIIGAEKACSGCLIPLLSALDFLRERGVKCEEPLKVYIGQKPREAGTRTGFVIGDCAIVKDANEAGSAPGCPPDRQQVLSRLISLFNISL